MSTYVYDVSSDELKKQDSFDLASTRKLTDVTINIIDLNLNFQ